MSWTLRTHLKRLFFFTWSACRCTTTPAIGCSGRHVTTADGETWLDLGAFSYIGIGHGERRVMDAVAAGEHALSRISELGVPRESCPRK